MFDPGTMRKRFHELGAKRDEILAVSGPMRAKRDALIAEHTATVKALEAQIREAEKGLYDIDKERGLIAKALSGKTGSA